MSVEEGPGPKHLVAHIEHTADGQPAILHDHNLMVTEANEKMNAYCVFLCVVAGMSGLLFGYDTGVIGAALVNIRLDLGHALSDTEKEWIGAGTSCGALIGGLGGGTLADVIGRKWTLFIGDVAFLVGAVLIASSYSVEQMIVGRVVLGFGVGIAAAVSPMYISELAPARLRGTLVTIQSIMITGGQTISYAIGAGMTFNGGWRALFAISIIPAIMQGSFIHYLPESPRYDLLKGRVGKARETMNVIYKDASEAMVDSKINGMQEMVDLATAFNARHTYLQRLKALFATAKLRKATFCACGLMFFQQFSGQNSLLYYSATLFSATGFNNPTAVGLIFAAANFFFTIVSMGILDRVGKRRILLLSWPFMVAGLALSAMSFVFLTKDTGGQLIDGYDYSKKWVGMMIGMLVLFISTYAIGLGNIPWHGSELFPLENRGMGSALLTGTCWSTNIIISSTFLSMLTGIGGSGTYGFYAGLSAVGYVFVVLCYPEVKGLSLEEVQMIFTEGFGIKKANEIRAEHRLAEKETQGGAVNSSNASQGEKEV